MRRYINFEHESYNQLRRRERARGIYEPGSYVSAIDEEKVAVQPDEQHLNSNAMRLEV